jgi:hypothetical protein
MMKKIAVLCVAQVLMLIVIGTIMAVCIEGGGCPPAPILAPKLLEEYLRKGATMTRGIAPHITEFRSALRRAWVKGALQFALQEALRIECTPAILAAIRDVHDHILPLHSADFLDEHFEQLRGSLELLVHNCTPANTTELDWKSVPDLKYFQALHLRLFDEVLQIWAQNERMAQVASELLGGPVRLYQDAFFRKGDEGRMGGKPGVPIFAYPTNLHRDFSMIPADAAEYVTAWCPLSMVNNSESSALFFFGTHPPYVYRGDSNFGLGL